MFITHNSVFTMENANFIHNMGPLWISSFGKSSIVEFYGSNTFAYNNCKESAYSVLHLMQGNATFYGNTTFLWNKGRYGGAICAQDAEINFQENVMFLYNEGEYGGALLLYQSNVSVLSGQFAEVSFFRNHAQESGGAVYARDSQIVASVGKKLSFVEHEGYNGGAMTLTGHSTLYLEANSSVVFVSNHAYHYGGAISKSPQN